LQVFLPRQHLHKTAEGTGKMTINITTTEIHHTATGVTVADTIINGKAAVVTTATTGMDGAMSGESVGIVAINVASTGITGIMTTTGK